MLRVTRSAQPGGRAFAVRPPPDEDPSEPELPDEPMPLEPPLPIGGVYAGLMLERMSGSLARV